MGAGRHPGGPDHLRVKPAACGRTGPPDPLRPRRSTGPLAPDREPLATAPDHQPPCDCSCAWPLPA